MQRAAHPHANHIPCSTVVIAWDHLTGQLDVGNWRMLAAGVLKMCTGYSVVPHHLRMGALPPSPIGKEVCILITAGDSNSSTPLGERKSRRLTTSVRITMHWECSATQADESHR